LKRGSRWVGDGNDGREEERRETMLTTSDMRFIGVPNVFVLDCVVVMVLLQEKKFKQTVTSRIAQRGTRIPAGTGFGNLGIKFNVKCNRFSTPKLTVKAVE